MLNDIDAEDHYSPSTRLVEVERLNNGSSSWGFHLTRGKWDPYPWITSIDEGSAASAAGLKPGDCLLEVNGEDVLGQRVSEIAELVKSKSDKQQQISLLLWNAGVDPHCSPETVCCGPMPTNLQRLSACMSTILAFLECPVCLDTISPPTYQCDNGHLICIKCRTKSERCPVCRLRLNRGRSLLSDQVYNALIDAFSLKEEPDSTKSAKVQNIFRLKNKTKTVLPEIKITPIHTNKLLARLTGKSTSVDNLSVDSKYISTSLTTFHSDFDTNLKTKSLSTHDIFQSESPAISRSSSVSRLRSRDQKQYLGLSSDNKSASCHGSFESLHKTNHGLNLNSLATDCADDNLYHCPFVSRCPFLVKGKQLLDHFQQSHEGPLIQFFKPQMTIYIRTILKHRSLCYVIRFDNNTFFVRVELISDLDQSEERNAEDNILLWVWFLGDNRSAKNYDLQVKVIRDESKDFLFSVRNGVCSLTSCSYQEIRDSRKGVFLCGKTLNSLNSGEQDIKINVNIVKNEIE